MPCMPEVVAKGTILKKLDFLLSDHHKRVAILSDLLQDASLMPLTYIAERHGAGLTKTEMTHLDNDWFTNWWPYAQALSPTGVGGVEEVVRLGLIEAIRKAEELQVPVDTYWMCHLQHDHHRAHFQPDGEEQEDDQHHHDDPNDRVEASVCWSTAQVTLSFHTPGPPPDRRWDPARMIVPEPIKVIRHGVRRENFRLMTVDVQHMPTFP